MSRRQDFCAIFWCILPGGRRNSVTAGNWYEVRRRALELGAIRLFMTNPAAGKTVEPAP